VVADHQGGQHQGGVIAGLSAGPARQRKNS